MNNLQFNIQSNSCKTLSETDRRTLRGTSAIQNRASTLVIGRASDSTVRALGLNPGRLGPVNSKLGFPVAVSADLRPHGFSARTARPRVSVPRQRKDRLVGLVVKASASRAEDPVFESRLRRSFSGSSHTTDLKIGTPVATLLGARRYSARTCWPGVSIL